MQPEVFAILGSRGGNSDRSDPGDYGHRGSGRLGGLLTDPMTWVRGVVDQA